MELDAILGAEAITPGAEAGAWPTFGTRGLTEHAVAKKASAKACFETISRRLPHIDILRQT
ncbi:MAG: hypothetical protein AAFV29_06130, partial [Myxococcota bacterium]